MDHRTVLISGAGVAGPTLAYWLARGGYRPTLVERADGQRSSGAPVDVRGPAFAVAEQMGVLPRLRAAATEVRELIFVDGRGRRAGRVNMGAIQSASGRRELELPRGDLASILLEAGRDTTELLWGDSIASLTDDGQGVDVRFERGQPRRFDLVIGADGLHSVVRRLAFGPESDFAEHMGLYVATVPLEGAREPGHQVVMYNVPGRMVGIHPSRSRPMAAFIFRGSARGFDHRDGAQHRRLLAEAYRGDGWRVPELLERAETADLYFDSVSRVRLPAWSQGRVALLGDAASCVSLFGDGSTLAMAGAFTLASALAAHPRDHRAAFRQYEAEHRTLVNPRLEAVGRAASLLIPATRAGIFVRNLATRLWPVAAAGGWLRRQWAQ